MDDRRSLSRRDFLRLSAAAATGALAAACAPAAPQVVEVEKPVVIEKEVVKEVPVEKVVEKEVVKEVPVEKIVEKEVPAKPAKKVEIEWWYEWGGSVPAKALHGVRDAFNLESQTVFVHGLQVTDAMDKYLTAIGGGAPPDVAICNGSYPEIWAREVVMPLDDWIETSDVIVKEDIFPSSWVEASWQGKIYGIPAVESYLRFGLCYHEKVVQDAGLDPGNPPETWDETFEWHEQINKLDAVGNLEILGFDPREAMAGSGPGPANPLFWAQSFGLEFWTREDSKFHFDDPKWTEALKTIKRFYDAVGVEKIEGYRSSYSTWTHSPTSSFPAGVQAMSINGYWVPGEMQIAAPGKRILYSWSPVPSERKGIKFQSTGGHFFNIPVGAPSPEAAFEFATYCTTDKACDIIFDAIGWLGARISYLERIDLSTAPPGLDWFIRSATEADEMNACAGCPISGFVSKKWRDGSDAVNYGTKTAEEAAKDLQEECTEELGKSFPELVS